MNYNIGKVLNAIEILGDVQGCELEITSLSHKVKAMYEQGKDGLEGIPFIDACSDEELAAALKMGDPRTHMRPFICPFTFNYLRRNRPRALAMAQPK
jgi:hypothetical protein